MWGRPGGRPTETVRVRHTGTPFGEWTSGTPSLVCPPGEVSDLQDPLCAVKTLTNGTRPSLSGDPCRDSPLDGLDVNGFAVP